MAVVSESAPCTAAEGGKARRLPQESQRVLQELRGEKRPRRKHGEHATGVVRRRADWDDHCLIEMDDGFEDVFCHRHRCQGKQLPEQGQVVDFKLRLALILESDSGLQSAQRWRPCADLPAWRQQL